VSNLSAILDFIFTRHLKSITLVIIIIEFIIGYVAIQEIGSKGISFGYSHGGYFSFVSFLGGLIVAFLSVYLMTSMTREISNGVVTLYLSQPIRRVEYIFGWLLASIITPLLLLWFGIAVLGLIVSPDIIYTVEFYEFILLMLELYFNLLICFSVSILFKSAQVPALAGLGVFIILPFVFIILIALSSISPFQITIIEYILAYIFGIFYPQKYYSMIVSSYNLSYIVEPWIITTMAVVIMHLLIFYYSKKYFEVS